MRVCKFVYLFFQEKTETAPTIVEELFEYGKYEIERPFKKRLTDGKMLKQLKAWGAGREKLRRKEAENASSLKVCMAAFTVSQYCRLQLFLASTQCCRFIFCRISFSALVWDLLVGASQFGSQSCTTLE
jgi:hypothetical protein